MDFFRFLGTRKFLKHFLGILFVGAILTWIILFFLRVYTKHGEYLDVPDFKGKNLTEVKADDAYSDFEFVIIDSLFDLKQPKGSILHQDPFPGSRVKEHRKIYVTIVSFFPDKTSMPDLKYLTLRQAVSTLEGLGLKVGRISYIPSFDADAVQQQKFDGKVIAPGTKLDKGSAIDLTVGMGSGKAETGYGRQDNEPEQEPEDSLYKLKTSHSCASYFSCFS